METILIALGSNCRFGDNAPDFVVDLAIQRLRRDLTSDLRQSRLYRSPAFPKGSGPDFINAAVVLQSDLPAAQILSRLHAIEAGLGRERAERWGPRTADLDLIAVGGQVVPNRAVLRRWMDLPADDQRKEAPDQLILPHPRMQDRAFVLMPLAELAPGWIHPVTGRSVAQMVDDLSADARGELHPLT